MGVLCCISAKSNTAHFITNMIDTPVVNSVIVPQKKPSKWLQWQPTAYFVGVDAAKGLYNLLDTNKLRLEFVAEAFVKNTNWLTAQVGFCNAKFATNLLQYNSQSRGVLISMSKSLFPFVNKQEMDNAFVGIGYGMSINKISEATYTITDIWGTSSGVIPASNKIAHFAELNLGFRLALGHRIMASWRIQGKALLNSKAFTTITPVYIANYGAGDKSTNFGYNFMVTYRVK